MRVSNTERYSYSGSYHVSNSGTLTAWDIKSFIGRNSMLKKKILLTEIFISVKNKKLWKKWKTVPFIFKDNFKTPTYNMGKNTMYQTVYTTMFFHSCWSHVHFYWIPVPNFTLLKQFSSKHLEKLQEIQIFPHVTKHEVRLLLYIHIADRMQKTK